MIILSTSSFQTRRSKLSFLFISFKTNKISSWSLSSALRGMRTFKWTISFLLVQVSSSSLACRASARMYTFGYTLLLDFLFINFLPSDLRWILNRATCPLYAHYIIFSKKNQLIIQIYLKFIII